MNRRDFLSRFAQTVAGAAIVHTLDVDKLLWVAGERTIFLPSANTLITPELVTLVSIDRVTFSFWRTRPCGSAPPLTFESMKRTHDYYVLNDIPNPPVYTLSELL